MKKTGKGTGLALMLAAIAIITLLTSLYQIDQNKKAFHITSTTYSRDGIKFRPVNLPFFNGDGYFIINFTTNKNNIDLYFFVNDCIEYGLFNGKRFSGGECTVCKHCKGVEGHGAAYPDGRTNTLVLKTINMHGVPFVIVENAENDFIWMTLSLLSALTLVVLVYAKAAGRNILSDVRAAYTKALGNRELTAILLVSLFVQIAVMPNGQSSDIVNWMVRTENLYYKQDWSFTKTSPDYMYNEASNMCKPPGAYLYPFLFFRVLFGFNHIYTQLLKLPPIIGSLIVSYAIWSVLSRRIRNRRTPLIAAALYALNPAVIFQAAYLGKHDSLTIGILLLALSNLDTKFFPALFGLAVLGKQLPMVMVPWLVIQKKKLKQTLLAGLIFVILVSPFLLDDPKMFLERLVLTNTEKMPRDLSWMINLGSLGDESELLISKIFLAAYLLLLVPLALLVQTDAYVMGSIAYMLFIVFSKVVYEQYVLWTIPFLIITYFLTKKKAALAAFIAGTVSCIINHEGYQLLPDNLANIWNMLLAAVFLIAAADLAYSHLNAKAAKKKVIELMHYVGFNRKSSIWEKRR